MLLSKLNGGLWGMLLAGMQSYVALGSVTDARVLVKRAEVVILEHLGCQHYDDQLIGDACSYRVQVVKSKDGLAGELTLFHRNRADAFEVVFGENSTLTLDLRQVDETGGDVSKAQEMIVERIVSLENGEFHGGVHHIIAKVKSKKDCKLIDPDAMTYECRYRMQNLTPHGEVPARFDLVYYVEKKNGALKGQLNLSSQSIYHLVTQNSLAPYGEHRQLLVESWHASKNEVEDLKGLEQKECPALAK